jgi:WD40 repeat protein
MLFFPVNKCVVAGMLSIFILLTSAGLVSAQPWRDCSGICNLEWSPVEENLFAAVDEFGLWLIDTNESNSPPQFFPHEFATSLSFDPTGKYVAVTSCPALVAPTEQCNGSISLFDIQEQSWTELGAYDYTISNVKFSPDGRYVAFQKDERGVWGIQLIDLTTNNTFQITDGMDRIFTNLVVNYAFDPQSDYIALSNGAYGTEGHAFWGLSLWRLSDQALQAFTDGSILAACGFGLYRNREQHHICAIRY